MTGSGGVACWSTLRSKARRMTKNSGRSWPRLMGEVESFFLRCVASGQRDKTIPKAQSAEDLARLLLNVLLGIRVLARVRPDRKLLEGLVRPVFALLDNADLAKRPRKTKRPAGS